VPELGRSMDLARYEDDVWKTLREACIDIAAHCGHFAIACNTLHYFAPRIAELGLPAQLVSIVEAARNAVRARGCTRVALLGADPVLAVDAGWSPYGVLRDELELELPADSLQPLILDIKRRGGAHPAIVERFDELLEGLGADTVLLACTELPLVATRRRDKTLLDLTSVLADALVDAVPIR